MDFSATLEYMSLYKKSFEVKLPSIPIDKYTDLKINIFENIIINKFNQSIPEFLHRIYGTKMHLCDVKDIDGSLMESDTPITVQLIQDHIEGRKEIHAYLLGPENKVNSVCVKLLDKQSMIRFRGLLDMVNPKIKTLFIREDNSYNVWFFFKYTSAKDAHGLVKYLLEKAEVKKSRDDEGYKLFPAKTFVNSQKDKPVKLPFFDKYQNIVDGEGILDESIEVSVIKLSSE